MGIECSKIAVNWVSGKGTDSYTSSILGFMVLAGADYDECDENVICHEYGHWVYGTLRKDGQFMGGGHSAQDNIGDKLAYSEGLATFFGQTILNSDRYYDGNRTMPSSNYSIETPPEKFEKSDKNEAYVSASLWDITDPYSAAESWDKICDAVSGVLKGNIDVVREAKISPFRNVDNIKNLPDKFNTYNCTIQDFYNKYFDKNITHNSEQAYDFWNIFNHNGMQFDLSHPLIGIPVSSIVVGQEEQKLDFRIYDNVKVSKVKIYINRTLQKTYYEPTNDISYTIPKNVLKKGRNKLSIVAYDYANNIRTIGKNVSKLYPVKDINVASNAPEQNLDYQNTSYRQPYSVAYVDVFVDGDTNDSPITTASLAKSAIQEETELETFTNDSIIQELAEQYSLTLTQQVNGSLEKDASTATQEVTISDGNDYAFLLDDTLGDFEITLTDPNGTTYTNAIDPEDAITENESKT
jgi:hypothetical protein